MVLYTCASCVLGWTSIPHLAKQLLAKRSLNLQVTRALCLVAALYCATCALAAWVFLPPIACLAFSFGGACMAGLLVCDIRTRVLPTELVMFLLVFAVMFRLAMGSLSELFTIALCALFAVGVCILVNRLHRLMGKSEAIGMGDIRCIVPLAIYSGATGTFYGVMACALVMGLLALAQIILKHADVSGHIAMAPGLAVWLFVGALIPFTM